MTQQLPEGFEALDKFASVWAVPTAAERDALRTCRPASERAAFHLAIAPLIEPALTLLDRKAITAFDQRDTNLMRLVLAYAHVAHAEDVQGPDEAKHALSRPRLTITRAPADA